MPATLGAPADGTRLATAPAVVRRLEGLRLGCAGQSGLMLLRNLATAVAAGRVAFGAGMILAPRLMAAPWIGEPARDRRAWMVIRGFGARDLALGAGGLHALHGRHAGPAQPWFAAQVLADVTDLVVTARAGSSVPPLVRLGVVALAASAAAIGGAVAAAGSDALEGG